MRDFHFPGRSPVLAANGLCATSHPLAAEAAVAILRAGGNAVDAAIAGAMVLTVAEPHMCGLAGDCFALVKPAGDERVVGLNGSGRAPASMDAQALRDRGLTAIPGAGPEAITLPGAVDALCMLSQDCGLMALADVLAPAIRLAEEGVPVAPRVARDWAAEVGHLKGAAHDFYLLDGRAPGIGTRFRAPGVAEVLRRIADQGRAGFYEGEVAEDMIASLRALGLGHTLDDLTATRCDWTEPLTGSYKGVDLLEHPPNGQGATAHLILNILSHFDVAAMDPLGTARAHLEAEATKLAYDARNRFIADPDHTTRLGHMLAPETAAKLAALIDPSRAMPAAAPLTEAVHRDTVLITVVDSDRMAVSLIYSLFSGFGSGFASEKFGLLFQNRGAGFNLEAGHPNEAGPGKRPMHTIIPGMLATGGRVTMPFGVMGGAYQATGHARFLSNMVDFGMDPQEAIDAPRCFAGLDGLRIERGYSEKVRAEMVEMGHALSAEEAPLGGAQAIRIDHAGGYLEGASDPRKDGCAIGY
jgi:gamma-glutamyltranspeptidase / glutathione hydrolase